MRAAPDPGLLRVGAALTELAEAIDELVVTGVETADGADVADGVAQLTRAGAQLAEMRLRLMHLVDGSLCSWHHHRAHDPTYALQHVPDGGLRFSRRRSVRPAA
ncbi:hypothetical protein [Nocardioides terrisoli]|uniref:hypothetical protein n=1 Tax=Nocardioides terrisoli TaxID=3388267 RepID=UPI00287B7DED|nr:hypothetical protein [Nocardioides marmorisolisilvae]